MRHDFRVGDYGGGRMNKEKGKHEKGKNRRDENGEASENGRWSRVS
jgi:hypothetical protein